MGRSRGLRPPDGAVQLRGAICLERGGSSVGFRQTWPTTQERAPGDSGPVLCWRWSSGVLRLRQCGARRRGTGCRRSIGFGSGMQLNPSISVSLAAVASGVSQRSFTAWSLQASAAQAALPQARFTARLHCPRLHCPRPHCPGRRRPRRRCPAAPPQAALPSGAARGCAAPSGAAQALRPGRAAPGCTAPGGAAPGGVRPGRAAPGRVVPGAVAQGGWPRCTIRSRRSRRRRW